MKFLLIQFTCNMFIPLIMIAFGKLFENNAPKSINGFYGYRTKMSMKNKDTWEFAHKYCGKLWKKIGAMLCIITLILTVLFFSWSEDIQGTVLGVIVTIQMAVLVGSIFLVESALKKNFDKDGLPK